MSDSLQPHGLYYTRLPYPSQSPGVCWNSCLLSQWCHPIISSSISPLSSCLQSFPASGSFLMSRFFASGDQSIGASASASVLPMNIQGWFLLGLTSLISREGNGTPLQYFCLENPMDGGAWWAAIHGVARVGHDWETSLSLFTFMHWRRKWQPTPVFLPGESQGWGAWWAAVYGVTQSRTRLKWLSIAVSISISWRGFFHCLCVCVCERERTLYWVK